MKKFSFKSVLILMLILLLAFSLVACNKDKGGSDPEPDPDPVDPYAIETSVFFDKLWAGANSIGSQEIKDTDDIALSVDLGVNISSVNSKATVFDTFGVGLAAQIVYDRDMTNTAVKVQLYNPNTSTSTKKANWVAIYYFLSDPYYLYFDFDGQQIKLYFDTSFDQTQWSTAIKKFLDKDVVGTGEDAMSVAEIISEVAGTTLEGFDLNELLEVVLNIVSKAVKVDITGILEKAEALNIQVKDGDHFLLQNVFKSEIVKALLSNTRCVDNKYSTELEAKYNYSGKTRTANTLLGILSGLKIGGATMEDIGLSESVLNGTVVGINFGMDGDNIDGFGISIALKGLKDNSNNNAYPLIEVNINDFNLAPIDASKATDVEAQIGINKGNYKEDLTFEVRAEISSKGVTIHPKSVDEKYTFNAPADFKLDGTLIVDVKLSGNVGKDDKGNDREIYLDATISKLEESTEKVAIEVAYDGNTIILYTDDSVEINGNSIVGTIFDSLGGYIYESMKARTSDKNMSDPGGFADKFLDCYLTASGTNNGGFYDSYGYKKENGNPIKYAKLALDFNDLIYYGFHKINEGISMATAADEEEKIKEAYPLFIKDVPTMAKDLIKAISTNNGKEIKATLTKSLVSYMGSWFYLGEIDVATGVGTDEEWYARSIAYNQAWADAFIKCGYFAADYNYKSINRDTLNEMWTIAKKYYEAKDATAKQAVLTEYSAKFTKNLKYEDFANAMDGIMLLFGDKFVTIAGTTANTHWYDWAFNQLQNAYLVLSLEDGITATAYAKFEQKLEKAEATIKLAIGVIEDKTVGASHAALKTRYQVLAAKPAYDFGTITGLKKATT